MFCKTRYFNRTGAKHGETKTLSENTVFSLLRSVLLEETNKLTTPRPQDRTLGGLHTAAERGQPAEQEQRQG